MYLRILIGIAVGASIGAVIGYFGQCSTGTCPLTSTWWRGAIYGAVMGLVLMLASSPAHTEPGKGGTAGDHSGISP